MIVSYNEQEITQGCFLYNDRYSYFTYT